MKSSLILEHIKNLIIEELREGYNYHATEFTIKYKDLQHLSEEILDMLEFQGMLPPPHYGNLPKIEGNDVHLSWESEDEK